MTRITMGVAVLSLVTAMGCKNDDETGDTGLVCENSVVSTFPVDGETAAYYRTTVEVLFDDYEADATFTVSTGGTEVAGTHEWVGDNLVFTPTDPLAPSTSYDVAVTYSCGTPAVAWSTGEVGDVVGESVDLVGKTYNLDLTSGRFVKPAGVGSILQSYIGDTVILLGVTAVDAKTIDMIGALGKEGVTPPEQDTTQPTIPFPTAVFTANPYFAVGPETTTIEVMEYSITIEDLFISGAFAPDGSYIAGAELAGLIDTRPLVPLVDDTVGENEDELCNGIDDDGNDLVDDGFPDEDEDGVADCLYAICDLAEAIGVMCEPCPGAGDMFCLSLQVDSIAAAEVPGVTLVVVED